MKFSFLLLTCCFVSGCVTGTAVQTGSHTYAQKADWTSIRIIFEKPSRPYEIIGPVSALGAPAAEERAVFDMLKQQAAKLGADAVLVGSPGSNSYYDGFFNGKKNAGLAIKYTRSETVKPASSSLIPAASPTPAP